MLRRSVVSPDGEKSEVLRTIGELRRRRAGSTAQQARQAAIMSQGEAAVSERVRERENQVREGKKKIKNKKNKKKKEGGGGLKCLSIKLLVTTCMLSLQATFSDANLNSSLILPSYFMFLFLVTTYFCHYLSHSRTK